MRRAETEPLLGCVPELLVHMVTKASRCKPFLGGSGYKTGI